MAKFCTKCGAPLNENSAFCTNCGAAQDSKNTGSTTANAADAVANTFNNVKDKINTDAIKDAFSAEGIKNLKSNPNKKVLIILGGAVLAAIIIIVLLISLIFGGGYKSAIDNYFDGIENANAKKLFKAMPDCMIDYLDDTIDDYEAYSSLKEYTEDTLKDFIEEAEDEYGKDIKFSYEITDKEELSGKELREIKKSLRSLYDDDDIKVTKGYEVDITATIKGDDDSEEDDITMTVAKVDGDWCIVDGGFLSLF